MKKFIILAIFIIASISVSAQEYVYKYFEYGKLVPKREQLSQITITQDSVICEVDYETPMINRFLIVKETKKFGYRIFTLLFVNGKLWQLKLNLLDAEFMFLDSSDKFVIIKHSNI